MSGRWLIIYSFTTVLDLLLKMKLDIIYPSYEKKSRLGKNNVTKAMGVVGALMGRENVGIFGLIYSSTKEITHPDCTVNF